LVAYLAHYEQLVAQLLHQHHFLYVATPAVDIVKATTPKATNIYTAYLQYPIASSAARYADIFDIQAQGTETNLTQFKSFVSGAAEQVRQANPDGKSVTFTQLDSAYTVALPYADGFWLNIPGQSTQCPNCGTPQPKLGVELLQKIY
jgi:hypothetical protein